MVNIDTREKSRPLGKPAITTIFNDPTNDHLCYHMGQKPAQVVCNQRIGLPYANASRLLAYYPTANNGVIAFKFGQGKKLLVYVPFFTVFALCLQQKAIVHHYVYIRTLPA
jgi:hypothetical protein